MPTYEYLCQACGTRFEVWQKMSDEPLTTCRTCGGHVRRVLYPAGIVFRGSGFYSTDHRSSGTSTAAESTANSDGEKPREKSVEKPGAAAPSAESKPAASSGTE